MCVVGRTGVTVPYGQKVTGLASNGINLSCFYINGKRRRKNNIRIH